MENIIVYTEGYKKINKVHVMKLSNDNSSIIGNKLKINCDLLCVSGGYTPAVHLFTQSGGKLTFNEEKYHFHPKSKSLDQISVGSCNGIFNLKKIIEETQTKTNEFLNSTHNDQYNIAEYKSGNFENIWLLPSDKNFRKNQTFCRLSK